MRKVSLVGSTAIAMGLGMSAAQAQEAPAGAPDDIIVTAQRRAERLERVPVSVAALGSQQLEERGVRSITDLQAAFPGVTMRQAQSQNTVSYSIRGQSIDPFSFSFPAVVPYINEIQQTSSGPGSFYDLDSVQVLKGPQGTLFGRNATGGAVLYTTKKPTNKFEGFIDMALGDYRYREGQAALNVPIVDDAILLRVAGNFANRDGYIHNLYDGSYRGVMDRESVRASLTLNIGANLSNETVAEYSRSGGDNTGMKLYSVYPCGQASGSTPLACGAGLLFSPGLDGAIGVPGAWAAYLAAHPKAFPGGLAAYLEEQKKYPFYTANQQGGSSHYQRSYYISNMTKWEIDDLTLKNIF